MLFGQQFFKTKLYYIWLFPSLFNYSCLSNHGMTPIKHRPATRNMLRRGTWIVGGFKKEKNAAKRNISSAMCVLSIYSPLCMKMLSFQFVRAWSMPRISYLSCRIPFPVWTPGIISGLTSVVVWLSR